MNFSTHNTNILAMIMAGGKGERLQPLTRDRAKPAVHYGGKYRIIDFVLNNFINSGIFKIKILTQFKSDSLNKHISAAWNLNRSLDQYVDLVPAQMRTGGDWYRGTADAIYQNINLITDEKPDLVAVFGGDHIYKMDINQMVDFHLSRAALLTIAAIPVPVSEASEFGIIEVNSDGSMIGFEEKPTEPKEMPDRPGWCLASMGNYVFNSKFLVRELTAANQREGSFDFGKDIIPRIFPDYPVYVYDFNTNVIRGEKADTRGYWRDVGTIEAFYEANMDLCASDPIFRLYNNNFPIRTLNWNVPPAKFTKESPGDTNTTGVIANSIISAGCIVDCADVVHSVLSPGVTCEKGSLIEDSILFPEVSVGAGAKIRRAIIEKGVRIPRNYEIGYDLERDKQLFHVTEQGIVVIAKETIIKA
ncbi:MAG: glucose-1-phosphate adenylyltransferase [Fibrobacter sp.]|nr:glucose-1-phosphate adenylyltransferase [Fibrobacter sp.]